MTVDTLTIATETPKACSTRREAIESAFLTNLEDEVCDPAQQCTAWIYKLAPRHDGGAWVLGSHSGDRTPHLWLAHLDAEGRMQKLVSLDDGTPLNWGGSNFALDMAVDESNHAFVAVYALESDPNANSELGEISWIQEVDADGARLLARVDDLGLSEPHILLNPDGRMTVAGNAFDNEHYGLLGQLDKAGTVEWSTNSVPSTGTGQGRGVVGLSAAAKGDYWVFGERDSGRAASRMGLTRFDTNGNVTWDGVFDVGMERGERVGFAGGPSGHLTVMLQPASDSSTQESPEKYRMIHVDASGRAAWTYGFEHVLEPWLAVDPRDGAIYASDSQDLIRVSQDGLSCERFALSPAGAAYYDPDLGAVADDGRLWFASQDTIGVFRVGRTD